MRALLTTLLTLFLASTLGSCSTMQVIRYKKIVDAINQLELGQEESYVRQAIGKEPFFIGKENTDRGPLKIYHYQVFHSDYEWYTYYLFFLNGKLDAVDMRQDIDRPYHYSGPTISVGVGGTIPM